MYLFMKPIKPDDTVVTMGPKDYLELVLIGAAVNPLGIRDIGALVLVDFPVPPVLPAEYLATHLE